MSGEIVQLLASSWFGCLALAWETRHELLEFFTANIRTTEATQECSQLSALV